MHLKFTLALFLCFIPAIPFCATKQSSRSFSHRCWSGIKKVAGVTAGAMLGVGATYDVQGEGGQWPWIKTGCRAGSLAVFGIFGIYGIRDKMIPWLKTQAELKKTKLELSLVNQKYKRSEPFLEEDLVRFCNQAKNKNTKVEETTKSVSGWQKGYPVLSSVSTGVGIGVAAGLCASQVRLRGGLLENIFGGGVPL